MRVSLWVKIEFCSGLAFSVSLGFSVVDLLVDVLHEILFNIYQSIELKLLSRSDVFFE